MVSDVEKVLGTLSFAYCTFKRFIDTILCAFGVLRCPDTCRTTWSFKISTYRP
ncbi:hypothetical protein PLICRDRAFT_378004 [Plicaturopsis crispa FD-325 SS-3]|nr:hypothetical protein PLICRDRAFT_378004 [Plicaturopsis crispa FD-325 SS-3]